MKEYVLDANAVTRMFGVSKEAGGEKVKALFELADDGRVRLVMSVINLGEVSYVLQRHIGSSRADAYTRTVQQSVEMVDADQNTALEAARYKHGYKMGYADAFAVAVALGRKATLVSADPVFEKFGAKLKWMRLPRFVTKH